MSNIAQDTQPPRWQFLRQAGDESAAPPAPASEALWQGHGCFARYIEGEHVLWNAEATTALLRWVEPSAADRAASRWEDQDAANFARLAMVEAQRPSADARYVARLVCRAARAATNASLTREDWAAWGHEVALGAKKAGKSQGEIAEVIQHTRLEKRRLARERQSNILEALLLELVPACARELSAVSG